jgi:tripeptidyl-peptidase-1
MWKSMLPVVAAAQWTKMEADVMTHDPAVSSWVKGEVAPADHSVGLSVIVRVDDDRRAALEKTFFEVSDPKHANYGQYLSRDEVTELLAVPQDRVERISEYLSGHGCTDINVASQQDVVSVECPVSAIETALNTKLHFFTHKEQTDIQIVRASEHYHLPEHMTRDVTMVGELLQFPLLKSKEFQEPEPNGKGQWPDTCDANTCSGLVTPAVLSARYRHPNATGTEEMDTANSMAVAEFQGQKVFQGDLDKFSSSCHVPSSVEAYVGGGESTLRSGVEAALDVEYMKAVAPDVPLSVIYNSKFSLLDWCTQITNLENSPLIHSVSYGNDERQQSSDAYMFSANTAFMKAGAQGLSILFASGDQGVCGREGCGGGIFGGAKRFKPDFPAASPYITAVGGTDFLTYSVGDEQVWSAGGGGFSDTFDIPAYQADAVAAYKARSDAQLPDQSYWNNTGRGYPDVAALGGQKTSYCVRATLFEGVAGTSASCPVVAGIFARLNGLRLAAGKPALGFLNPFIYQNPQAFFDVTVGKNNANQADGFTATEGWDAATGFGTPNYDELAKAAMASVEVTV